MWKIILAIRIDWFICLISTFGSPLTPLQGQEQGWWAFSCEFQYVCNCLLHLKIWGLWFGLVDIHPNPFSTKKAWYPEAYSLLRYPSLLWYGQVVPSSTLLLLLYLKITIKLESTAALSQLQYKLTLESSYMDEDDDITAHGNLYTSM